MNVADVIGRTVVFVLDGDVLCSRSYTRLNILRSVGKSRDRIGAYSEDQAK